MLIGVPPDARVPPAVPVIVVNPNVVTTAVPGVVLPIEGGAAKTPGRLAGTRAVLVLTKPATACALVAKNT